VIIRWLRRILISLAGLLIIILVLLFAPVIWSAAFPEKPPVGYFPGELVYLAGWTGIEKLVNRKPEIPAGVKELKNIEYKNIGGKSLQLDMYIPDGLNKPVPLLVLIHGGAWRSGKRSDYLVYLVDFAKRGYITASVSYRLLADSCYPACVEDLRDALKWLVKSAGVYGYDPDRIALIGGSAGGHLAMLTGYGWHKPGDEERDGVTQHIKAVIDFYGPYDMATRYARNHRFVKTFITHPYDETPALYLQSSPKFYLGSNAPPTLIFHGTADRLVPVSQSDSLARRLEKLKVPFDYCRIPGWPHGMDVVERVNRYAQKRMTLFLDNYLNVNQ